MALSVLVRFLLKSLRSKPTRRSYKPQVMLLEDRTAPASLVWVGADGANWSVATNFSPAQVPQAADTVILDGRMGVGANTNSTMNLGGGVQYHIAKLILRGGYTGTLTLSSDLYVDVLNMRSAGTITGSKDLDIIQVSGGSPVGDSTIFDTSDWSRGTISTRWFWIGGEQAHRATLDIGADGATANLSTNMQVDNQYTTANWQQGNVTVASNKSVLNRGTFTFNCDGGSFGNNLAHGGTWFYSNQSITNRGRGTMPNVAIGVPGPNARTIRVMALGTTPGSFEIAGTYTQDQANTLTSVQSGTLLVTGSVSQSEGDFTIKGATILSVTGDYTEGADATLNVYLKTPSSGSGQVAVGDTISLAGKLNLTALTGFSGSAFTLISNTGSNAIDGTFTGLAEGAVLSVGGSNFQISYVGGTDGRDVLLSSTSSPITLTSSANPGYDGHSVTFTATMASSAYTGYVDFYDNGTYLSQSTLSSGVATYSTSGLAVGTHLIKAYYEGDGSHSVSSVLLTQAILDTPTIISADNAQFTMGAAGNFTVITNGSPTSTLSKSGSLPSGVTFTDNGDGTATLSGTPASGTVGSYTLTLSTADNGVSGGSTQTFILTVAKATPTVSVTDAGGAYTGSAYSATATVAGVLTGVDDTPASSLESVTPTLTYYSAAAPGTALSGAPSALGTYTVLASFAGSTNYENADNYVTFTIDPARVTSLSQTTGPTATGATTITITGVGFTGASAVKFGATNALSYTVNSDTSITATAPGSSSRGPVDVTVTNSYGTSPTSSADVFTYVNGAPSGANHTVTGYENSDYTFQVSDFGFTDLSDSPYDNFWRVQITTLPAAGTLKLDGVDVTAGQFITVADIYSGKLKFRAATNAYGNSYAAFTFKVQDDGGTANGGIDLDSTARTMTINVMQGL